MATAKDRAARGFWCCPLSGPARRAAAPPDEADRDIMSVSAMTRCSAREVDGRLPFRPSGLQAHVGKGRASNGRVLVLYERRVMVESAIKADVMFLISIEVRSNFREDTTSCAYSYCCLAGLDGV
jgi:hypothetical protein